MPHIRAHRTGGPGVGSVGAPDVRVFGRRLFVDGRNAAEDPFAGAVDRQAMAGEVAGFDAGMTTYGMNRGYGADIGSLNPYNPSSQPAVGPSLPIKVFPGQKVAVTHLRIIYKGPAAMLYLCWGVRKGGGDFNNGANLVDGVFASSSFSVPEKLTATQLPDIVLNPPAVLVIPASMTPSGNDYGTHKWIATQATANEAAFLAKSDTDSGVIQVQSNVAQVSNFDVAYALG